MTTVEISVRSIPAATLIYCLKQMQEISQGSKRKKKSLGPLLYLSLIDFKCAFTCVSVVETFKGLLIVFIDITRRNKIPLKQILGSFSAVGRVLWGWRWNRGASSQLFGSGIIWPTPASSLWKQTGAHSPGAQRKDANYVPVSHWPGRVTTSFSPSLPIRTRMNKASLDREMYLL